MIKKILIGLGVVIAVAVGIAAFQSPNYKISRDILIAASPSSLFPYINHSQKMGEWMPWKESDAQMVMSYAGPSEGVGSVASWDSPGPMGTGKSEIVESIPGKSVTHTDHLFETDGNDSKLGDVIGGCGRWHQSDLGS